VLPLIVASFQPTKHQAARSSTRLSTLAACVLLGFIFSKLPLQHLPLARIKFCAILHAFVPAKKSTQKGTVLIKSHSDDL